jgi:hypothetical protein
VTGVGLFDLHQRHAVSIHAKTPQRATKLSLNRTDLNVSTIGSANHPTFTPTYLTILILIFRLILVLLLCTAAPSGWAGDRIVERAYFVDASGSLTFADIQSKPLTPYTGILSRATPSLPLGYA